MNYSISELIYNEGLIFSLKFIFSKEYFDYLLSLKCSERFFLLLLLHLNCVNNISLSRMYENLEPAGNQVVKSKLSPHSGAGAVETVEPHP